MKEDVAADPVGEEEMEEPWREEGEIRRSKKGIQRCVRFGVYSSGTATDETFQIRIDIKEQTRTYCNEIDRG